MKKTLFIRCANSALAAALVSIFAPEDVFVYMYSAAVGFCVLIFVLLECARRRRPRWQTLMLRLIPAAVFISLACSHLPLQLTFRAYRAEFDRVADLIEKGSPPSVPFWIGPFKIKMVGRRGAPGTLYVATNTDAHEIDGFVKHPLGHGFNLWSCVALDDSWAYINED